MVAIPTLAEEDAKRPNREREALVRERTRLVNRMRSCLVRFGVRTFNPTLRKAPDRLATLRTPEGAPLPPNTLLKLRRDMARLRFVMDQIKGDRGGPRARGGSRLLRTSRMSWFISSPVSWASAWRQRTCWSMRFLPGPGAIDEPSPATPGLTGSPDESGRRRREKGLAKAGNARVRRGMIQLAWRFLLHQKESALAQWYRARTADARGGTRKTLIVALARKLLIALWRMVTTGEVPAGVVLRAA